jgi:hypothetical protein
VISDIPGTPSVVLPDNWNASDGATGTKDEAAKKGYVNDGIFAFLSPVLGTTPTIYYAENQILKSFGKQGEYSRATGLWATALFAVVFAAVVVGQIWPAFQIPIQKLLSPIAITPILIFIGLYIIAVPFVETPEKKTEGVAESKPHIGPEYYFPAAISVILTSRIGLEFALPISVLSFWLVRPKGDPMPGLSFRWISVGSVFTLIFFVSTFANPKTKVDLYPCKPCSECTCPSKPSPLKG